jgi:hypothetical protein
MAAPKSAATESVEEIVPPQREEFDATSIDASPLTVAPKRRGRPPGSKNLNSRSRSTANLENEIGGFLLLVNAPLQLVPALQRDALDVTEIQALAKATAQECQRNATFRKYVEQALKVQGGANLVGVVALIVGRRVVRHNIIPIPDEIGGSAGADAALGSVVAMLATGKPFNPTIQPTPVPEPAPIG